MRRQGWAAVLYSLVVTGGLLACHENASRQATARDGESPSPTPRSSFSAAPSMQPARTDPAAAGRAALLGLAVDPLSLKPTKTRLPSDKEGTPYGERIYTHYEYDVPSIGHVEQERKDNARWHLMAPATSVNAFAAQDELKALDVLGPARWFRVTGGPFTGNFLVRSLDTQTLSSRTLVCEEMATSMTPLLVAECSLTPR